MNKLIMLWIIVLLVISIPPFSQLLESSMLLHVLFQIPAFVIIGYVLAGRVNQSALLVIDSVNKHGVTGVIILTSVSVFWMIPSALDSSLVFLNYKIAKVLTLVVFVGATLRFTLRVIHPILKGVLMLEAWAMLIRFGYAYMVAPQRLCSSYLLSEQQLLGKILLIIGLVIGAYWTLRILLGRDNLKFRSMVSKYVSRNN